MFWFSKVAVGRLSGISTVTSPLQHVGPRPVREKTVQRHAGARHRQNREQSRGFCVTQAPQGVARHSSAFHGTVQGKEFVARTIRRHAVSVRACTLLRLHAAREASRARLRGSVADRDLPLSTTTDISAAAVQAVPQGGEPRRTTRHPRSPADAPRNPRIASSAPASAGASALAIDHAPLPSSRGKGCGRALEAFFWRSTKCCTGVRLGPFVAVVRFCRWL